MNYFQELCVFSSKGHRNSHLREPAFTIFLRANDLAARFFLVSLLVDPPHMASHAAFELAFAVGLMQAAFPISLALHGA